MACHKSGDGRNARQRRVEIGERIVIFHTAGQVKSAGDPRRLLKLKKLPTQRDRRTDRDTDAQIRIVENNNTQVKHPESQP